MSKKKTIEEINQYFAKEDYILLATEYINFPADCPFL